MADVKLPAFLTAATLALTLASVPQAAAISLDPSKVPSRTQITLRTSGGGVVSTPNANESRPALSLSKLYLGYWVLKYGAPQDKARVEEMIRVSHDGIANDLDRKYPQAIPGVIREFGLRNTHYNGYWGATTTSTNDVSRFTQRIYGDPVAAPIFRGMNNAAPVAADGYRQDFGTARIPGVVGTKFGWSNNRQINASVSTGRGFVIAANTYGPASTHTRDVLGAVRPDAPGRPSAPSGSSLAGDVRDAAANVPRELRPAANQLADALDSTAANTCRALEQAGSSNAC